MIQKIINYEYEQNLWPKTLLLKSLIYNEQLWYTSFSYKIMIPQSSVQFKPISFWSL